MTDALEWTRLRYDPGSPAGPGAADLVANAGTIHEQRVRFSGMLEIGRDEEGRQLVPGLLLLLDPTVSQRHCVLSQSADGRWYVRDLSRNGTRIAGRRLVPNVETEIHPGETLSVGTHELTLDTGAAPTGPFRHKDWTETDAVPSRTLATVLVGDIRDYTVLMRRVPSVLLQRSVSRVFERLTGAITELGGTIKEYAGDAVMAFWEGVPEGSEARSETAALACRAVLALERLARVIAADPAVWGVVDFPLRMDWALASGPVLIHTFGGDPPRGLSLLGEPVVLAYRLEKLAGDDTGPILVCATTRAQAGSAFVFRDLGAIAPKGFDRAEHVYALEGAGPAPPVADAASTPGEQLLEPGVAPQRDEGGIDAEPAR